ncbi:MAG: hypothetical protein IKN65_01145 [Clostridia bacterium]|nr:hypothetical protein [Clostridia bacterium]
MNKLQPFLASLKLKKDYNNWLRNNPEAMEENKKILKGIGNFLDEEISTDKLFTDALDISYLNNTKNKIVIKGPYEIIQLLDKYFISKGIVALKNKNSLQISHLP